MSNRERAVQLLNVIDDEKMVYVVGILENLTGFADIPNNETIEAIKEETVRLMFSVRIEIKVEREEVAKVTGTNKEAEAAAPKRRTSTKVGRNDLCPCGSGKKYKFCCGRGE